MNALHISVLLIAFPIAASFAEETNLTLKVDGVTYSNVTWGTVTPATVGIFYSTGVSRGIALVPLEKLSPELQKRFGYDPKKAAEYRTAVAAAQAEAARREALRKQLATEEADKRATEAASAEQRKQPQATDQAQPPQVRRLEFLAVEMLDVNRAMLTCAKGEKITVAFDANGQQFLGRCATQRAAWEQKQAQLAKAKEDAAKPTYTPRPWRYSDGRTIQWGMGYEVTPGTGMNYILPAPTFVVYAVEDGTTYRLIGCTTYRSGGRAEIRW